MSTFTAPTTSATDLTSGTLPDARLSSNVPLKNAANTFTQNQTVPRIIETNPANAVTAALVSNYTLTTTMAATGCALSIPESGMWLVGAVLRTEQTTCIPIVDFYHVGLASYILPTPVACDLIIGFMQGGATAIVPYRFADAATVQLHAKQHAASGSDDLIIANDGNGGTYMFAVRIGD